MSADDHESRVLNPPLLDGEREVIAHIFEVVFECLQRIPGAIPENVDPNLVTYEMNRLRNGHINEDD